MPLAAPKMFFMTTWAASTGGSTGGGGSTTPAHIGRIVGLIDRPNYPTIVV